MCDRCRVLSEKKKRDHGGKASEGHEDRVHLLILAGFVECLNKRFCFLITALLSFLSGLKKKDLAHNNTFLFVSCL